LDAVNIVDADVALLSSVGVDHTDWLGCDRESIGREKAGIFRPARPAVCGDPAPPSSVREEAGRIGAGLRVLGCDFTLQYAGRGWHWQGQRGRQRDLPLPSLAGAHQLANAASVLMVLELLTDRLPVTRKAIDAGLRWARLPGRIETIAGKVEQVLDVSHNAQAAEALVDALRRMPLAGRTHAVLGMMRDKDAESFVRVLQPLVDRWYTVGLHIARASPPEELAARVTSVVGSAQAVSCCTTVAEALAAIQRRIGTGDRVLVCGSFHTVAEWTGMKPRFD